MPNTRYRVLDRAARRKILHRIRDELGDQMFAEFMVDALGGSGGGIQVIALPTQAAIWLRRKSVRLGALEARVMGETPSDDDLDLKHA